MPRILMTGAAGGIGTSLRKLLPPIYPDLLLSDLKAPADLGKNEKFKAADLADAAQVEALCEGVDGILHFGGYSVEGTWDEILQSNIIGCYNLFEAARKQGVKRVVFGATVELMNLGTEEEVKYRIVGEDEADIKAGLVSINSPVARGLIGKSEGDTVTVQIPSGAVEYEILAVSYV